MEGWAGGDQWQVPDRVSVEDGCARLVMEEVRCTRSRDKQRARGKAATAMVGRIGAPNWGVAALRGCSDIEVGGVRAAVVAVRRWRLRMGRLDVALESLENTIPATD